MADLNETSTSKIDLTISDFRASGCAWCHPGGSVLEYDREGYRFDGKPGLVGNGANPNPKAADYMMAGLAATTTDASGYCKAQGCTAGTVGAGYFEVTAVSATLNRPEDTINQGTLVSAWDPTSGAWKTVGKKYAPAAAAGAAEVDCLMCHLAYQYANLERSWAFSAATTPKLAASLGLVGAGQGTVGLLNIAGEGTTTANPNIASSGWTWNQFWGTTTSTPGGDVTLRSSDLQRKPRNENCALCHFPDKSMAGTAAVTGPAGKPLGFTAFQKLMPAGSTRDGDELPGINGKDGNNDVEWKIAKGRVEGGKRGESLNDPNNRDAHMKWGSTTPAGALKIACADCHYALSSTYAAITDPAQGDAIIQPNVSVGASDHMFAKGDNTPDGKNMDQLDNTITCATCHISRTHWMSGSAPSPTAAHAGFPAGHLERISCKTCHIPSLNSPMNQDLADFTVGPFRTFERTQTTEIAAGVNRTPLYMWRQTEHGQGDWEIQPFDIMSVVVIANATAKNADGEATAVVPTFQRLGKRAAELLRASKGDGGDGVYDWPLNAPQGGDTTLIVNKPDEIADFFAQIAVAGGAAAPANPVIHFYFNQFSVSHNVVPKAGNPANRKYILGSPLGGGCVMCHSDSSNPASVGFFDRDYPLFAQPSDGGAGLVQTVLPAGGTLSGDLERVSIKFPYSNPIASGTTLPATFAAAPVSTAVNLSNAAGQTVGNAVNVGTLLGYGPEQLAVLKNPDTGSFTVTATATSGGTITDGPGGPSLLGSRRIPGYTDKAYTIAPAAGFALVQLMVNGVQQPVTATGMTYTVSVRANVTLAATFAPSTWAMTVHTGGTGRGTISTTGTDPDITCATGSTAGCSADAPRNTVVALTAAPAAGSSVTSWAGCTTISADLTTCNVYATGTKSVWAFFYPSTVTAKTAGTGSGTVSSTDTDPAITCTTGSTAGCSGSARNGGTVTLTAEPVAGSIISSWSGCTAISADKTACTVSMTGTRTATVTFSAAVAAP